MKCEALSSYQSQRMYVKNVAFPDWAISLFPPDFSFIIPFFHSWHLTAIPVWRGTDRSLHLGFFLFFAVPVHNACSLLFPASPGTLTGMDNLVLPNNISSSLKTFCFSFLSVTGDLSAWHQQPDIFQAISLLRWVAIGLNSWECH